MIGRCLIAEPSSMDINQTGQLFDYIGRLEYVGLKFQPLLPFNRDRPMGNSRWNPCKLKGYDLIDIGKPYDRLIIRHLSCDCLKFGIDLIIVFQL